MGDAPSDQPPYRDSSPASVEIDLDGTPEQVVRAVEQVAERTGCAVDSVESAAQPGERYRVVTRSPGSEDLGPVLTVYDLVDTGGGVTRVRIVQCGFGDQRAWDAAFESWTGRRRRAPMDLPIDLSIISWFRPGGSGPLPPSPPSIPQPEVPFCGTAERWPIRHPTLLDSRTPEPVPPSLVPQIERAYAQLVAMRRASPPEVRQGTQEIQGMQGTQGGSRW
ncbi:MAG: hypothetical protein ACRDJN_31675 [Chloroflexota bacterium]